jgi:hypothetical protein
MASFSSSTREADEPFSSRLKGVISRFNYYYKNCYKTVALNDIINKYKFLSFGGHH